MIEQQVNISERVKMVIPSPTVTVMDKARKLKSCGEDVIDLSGGDPDFDTAPHVTQAALNSLQRGDTHYAPSRGLPDLLNAVADKTYFENDACYDPAKEIIITPGAKTGLFSALQAVINPGDEVILFDPCWVSYAPGIQMAGGKPVYVSLDCQTNISDLEKRLTRAISTRTRVIIINSPNNPCGLVLTKQFLATIAKIAKAKNLLIISDEIYEKLLFDDIPYISIASLPGMRDRTVVINGLSKSHAMTGWRLGWLLGPEFIISQILKIHQHSTTCVTTFVQVGAVAALKGPQDHTNYMVNRYQNRRNALVSGLNTIPGIKCALPAGSFYVFPDVQGTGLSDIEFTNRLLEKELVAVTPGSAFGPAGEGHVRISFANADEKIAESLFRIERFVKIL